ncbi:monovalent cation/H(+) antiporter subunit G [Yoonia sp. 2307UL14-13]|uniref:monovalent cation/H(+) antiporter subunit G n=1 Tax=Yoonia sp. 2307UL14-13 TaxID=3126506 RepID=UPI0030AD0C87
MMTVIGMYVTAVALIVGAIFVSVGAIGLIKFNDSLTRMHAPTKVGTVGVGALLLASIIHSWTTGEGSIHQTLIMAFLFVTAPISANFIAKVNIHQRSCETPPAPPQDETWATLDAPEEDRELTEPAS